jgi:hypothetical protein
MSETRNRRATFKGTGVSSTLSDCTMHSTTCPEPGRSAPGRAATHCCGGLELRISRPPPSMLPHAGRKSTWCPRYPFAPWSAGSGGPLAPAVLWNGGKQSRAEQSRAKAPGEEEQRKAKRSRWVLSPNRPFRPSRRAYSSAVHTLQSGGWGRALPLAPPGVPTVAHPDRFETASFANARARPPWCTARAAVSGHASPPPLRCTHL